MPILAFECQEGNCLAFEHWTTWHLEGSNANKKIGQRVLIILGLGLILLYIYPYVFMNETHFFIGFLQPLNLVFLSF